MRALLLILVWVSVSLALQGTWNCTQSVFNGVTPSDPSPFHQTFSGNVGFFVDELDCSAGCYIDSNFSYTGYALTGYYHTGNSSSAPIHGVWSVAQTSPTTLSGLTYSFASGDTYLISCNSPEAVPYTTAALLQGAWDGTEGRVHASGIGATSSIHMRLARDTSYFVDHFGCESGCNITNDFGGTPAISSLMFGYYHDPNGNDHGVWFMYASEEGAPFVFTTSFESGDAYLVAWKASPPCTNKAFDCAPQMPETFSSNCGAWVLWRHVAGSDEILHQAFGYDNNFRLNISSPPSFALNSGYYSCGDNGSGQCVACGSSTTSDIESDVTCLGRVCRDGSSLEKQYQAVTTSSGLSSISPDESDTTCWFLHPEKGQSMDCTALWSAEMALQTRWNECSNFNAPPYSLLSRNCRYYVEAVLKEYCLQRPTDSICSC